MIRYRLVCASAGQPGHRIHSYDASATKCATEEGRRTLEAARDSDPVMQLMGNRGCVPWRVEAQFVSEWSTDHDRILELAVAEKAVRAPTLFDWQTEGVA